jgi:superfamily II DNA or RNA helicase
MKLRPYQKEIVDIMSTISSGSWLIQLPTGCGKTICFTTFINKNSNKSVLILAHREELVHQPIKYLNGPVGIEMADKSSNGERVVIASIQSLIKRLDKFDKNRFDVIITDECQHSSANSYQKIYNYFNFNHHFGFTATPNRNDGIKLKGIFDKIVYKKSLLEAIKEGYLCDIKCIRAFINYDLRKVGTRAGDFKIDELEEAMENTAFAIAEVYDKYAVGQTLIFACSVKHAHDIANCIPHSVLVTASTKNREKIIQNFTNRKFRCLINCMIFTEGTDLPLIETIIMARPTKNESLYQQMIGRGLRLYLGKDKLTLIDCVGTSENLSLCTAPSLLGITKIDKPDNNKDEITESLFNLPEEVNKNQNNINIWKINHKLVNIWAKAKKYQMHNVNWYKLPNGDLTLKLPNVNLLKIQCPNELDESNNGRDIQDLFDLAFEWLEANHEDKRYLWDLRIMKKWGTKPASDKQLETIKRFIPNPGTLTKLEASQILNRIFNK